MHEIVYHVCMVKQRKAKPASTIRFTATLMSPKTARPVKWTFLVLPKQASAKLASRGQTTVEGTINDRPFRATLEPDGQGGHWLKVDRKLRESLRRNKPGAEDVEPPAAGDVITLEIAPVPPDQEPEPKVPADLRKALSTAPQKAREVWSDITPIARRDWIQWIVSAKREETRTRRISSACDMLVQGKRRPCCFDRSGMFAGNLRCPEAE